MGLRLLLLPVALAQAYSVEVFAGKLNYNGRQSQQTYKVGQSHETIERIRYIPYQRQLGYCAQNYDQAEDDLIGLDYLGGLEQELGAAGSVQAPAQYGGGCEEGKANGDYDAAYPSESSAEGSDGKIGACSLAEVDGSAGHEYGEGGKGADNDGIRKYLEHAEAALTYGGIGISSGMGYRSRTKTGFVGEYAAAYATLYGSGDGDASSAAHYGGGSKGAYEYAAENVADVADMGKEDYQSGKDVNDRHEGHQLFSYLTYALEAAYEDDGAEDSDDDADYQVSGVYVDGSKAVDGAGDRGNDGVDLGHVTNTEGCQHSEECKQAAEPFPVFAKALADVVHRTAYPVALIVALAEMDSQSNFSKLGAHSEQCGNPHPEYSAGAAEGDGAGYAGDIAGTDGSRQSGANGLEGSYCAFTGFLLFEDLADGVLHYVAEPLELYPAAAEGVIHAGAYQKDHARPAHYDAVKEGVYFYDKFHQN